MSGPRFRFAPSPTGFFHVGGARTALWNWALAHNQGGTFVLRIEDTDEERNRPEWTQGIIDALAWIGIGADDPCFEGPYFQSHYAEAHVAAAHQLYEQGNAYYCDMTPAEVEARNKIEGNQGYQGWSRNLSLGPGPGRVLRFKVPAGSTTVHDLVRGEVVFDNALIEDFVLLRSNGNPMFLLANVVDDVNMRISHVVRAEEHLPNAPKQQMIWDALGHQPPVWAHVPVLVNEARKKLSKRRDKVALEQYRDEGYLPDAMVNYLMTLGWTPKGDSEIAPWSEMERDFRLEDVNHSPAFFDLKKLAAFNGDHIRMLSTIDFYEACKPWLFGPNSPFPRSGFDEAMFLAMAPHIQPRCVTLADAAGVVDFLFQPEPVVDEASWTKVMGAAEAAPMLAGAIAAYTALTAWAAEPLKQALEAVGEANGLKLGKAQAPVRVAVTGRTVGPPLFEALEVLGRDETLRRMRAAEARL
ncbi:MAG: glutamate--tRNA ligase [Actinobacteria bacterium]|uniref:glutamate--tRNA ligase n=1 Tax=freshwater metagenome TaxID=449393 RepID=A0A6J7C634_9ZZZZ|nr:glutamate--tRNA ligase [Actinomycetota bacterium]MSW77055.1 glutamate--tRNA ligase [Actinomycetota bacterium]MSX56196.1 glutamate--tRNA ligase [Actinomycetota bacterium]MSX92061.1 glutamate--tRNA ligase [Actinomycetota bacterium]MSZ83077.1 glutamate--tRNA ligase [Actinomycetota bacterium]